MHFGRAENTGRNINFPASKGRVTELDGRVRSLLWVRTGKAACHSLLPSTHETPAVPSPTATSPALGIAVQKWQAGNAKAGVDALKAVAAKLCQYGSGPRPVFSWAEVQRNLTALPVTENFSMRKDIEKLP